MSIQLGACQQKWLRMGFELMPAPTKDVLWFAETSVKNDADGGEKSLAFLYANVLKATQSCDG